ncbi:MAG: neutral/alkaline non-lysosomal ceramidase N-terminal domain-containing protein [Planctomyces sp.]|nr:neutral/alkaline non-lysosomal ceramidase N-terminal domain-containing protein [Planctomyces sp.]
MNRWVCMCLHSLIVLITVSSSVAVAEWKAGAAKVAITPQEPMWMSGYASRDRPADGTSHDLWAKALVLEDESGTRVVLVTLDLVGIDRQTSMTICKSIEAKHGFPRAHIGICTSHTHSGPVVGQNLKSMYEFDARNEELIQNYTLWLTEQVTSVVGQAVANVEPSVVRYGEGQSSVAVNRRNNREADVPALREAGKLVGPVDHALPVLAVRTPDGKLKSVVFGYACHATVLSLFQWSGDWPGFAQIEIEQQHPGTIALFWAGCGADQNPLPRRTVELAQQYGRQIAGDVNDVLNSPMNEVQGKLRAAYREIDLALGTLPTKVQIEEETTSTDVYRVRRARRLLQEIERDGQLSPTYPYPVQEWLIGDDVSFVLLGGEVVVEYSLRLKAELKSPATWVAGYSNDVMAYIPSARVLMEGGYEGATSMIYYGLPTVWSTDVEEHISRAVRELDTLNRTGSSQVSQ